MRVEDTMHGVPLTAFELKVKEQIARAPSPYDLLSQKEDEAFQNETVKRQLAGLLAKAKLTPRQKVCYRLIFMEQLSHEETAVRLGIAKRNVRRLQRSILKALTRTSEKKRVKDLADSCALTAKQKLVVSLFYGEQLPQRDIAQKLQMSVPALEKLLWRIRKIIFPRGNSLKCPGA